MGTPHGSMCNHQEDSTALLRHLVIKVETTVPSCPHLSMRLQASRQVQHHILLLYYTTPWMGKLTPVLGTELIFT